jgi:acylphosphatase
VKVNPAVGENFGNLLMPTFALTVIGKVQGVFFRVETKEQADRLGILGMVQNKPDGSVYIECSGNAAALDSFIAWCHQGPARAVVQQLLQEEIENKDYKGFEILR